ncbi:hypothetical protein KA005_71020, partial [bacterium]|nr:hypothetical protein [bacterium]
MVKHSIILMIGLLFILGSFISAVAQAQDVGGSIDHPVIQRLPDYYIWSYEAKKFDQHKFHTADGYVLKKGYKSHIQYSIEQGKSGHSSSQIISNYIEDIKKKGGEALYEDNVSTTLLLKTDDNETWIEIIAQRGSYYVTIVEQKETRYSVADKTVSTSVLQTQYPGVITQKKDYMELESSIFLRPPLVTYYVSAGADEGGNGTREHPFRTIGHALDNAENFKAMEVQIYLSDGTYSGDLLITRPTNITGEGEDTDIQGRISNSNFKLILKRLKISYATNRAIHQVG